MIEDSEDTFGHFEPGTQAPLPLDAPPLPPGVPLLPARMVNEYVYCPRLAYLEWVQGEWVESADTVEGRQVHRRVDRRSGKLPSAREGGEGNADAAEERLHVRSLELSSDALGLVARLDLAEFEGRRAVPVDYKCGRRPHVARGAYEPKRVQLTAQGLQADDLARAPFRSRSAGRRVGQEAKHPLFGHAAEYRQIVGIQCRLRGRHLMGEVERWPALLTRWLRAHANHGRRTPVRRHLRHRRRPALARNLKLMRGYGEWLQRSVFQCRLTRARMVDLQARLTETIDHGRPREDHRRGAARGRVASGPEPGQAPL